MKGILALLFVLALVCGSAFAVSGGSSIVRTNTINTGVVLPALQPIANNTSNSASLNTGLILNSAFTSAGTLSPALQYALQTGPYAYFIVDKNIQVFDTSTLKTVSTIKPDKKDGDIAAVAVSPDGKYIYAAVHWSEYYSEANYETYLDYVNIVRLNASTLQPIDYFHYDYVYPRHLAVAPDGKVYFGFQQGGYPDYGRFAVMDFSQGKSWGKEYNQLLMFYNFKFSPDGSHTYYSSWWDCPKVYDYDVPGNTIYTHWVSNNCSDDYYYVRSMAVAQGVKTLYMAANRQQGIIAMNTEDQSMRLISTDYVPLSLTASKDGNTLYAIGYFMNSEDKPVYIMHKYGGLKWVWDIHHSFMDLLVFREEAFTYDSLTYITPPDGSFPTNMEITADGKFGFISTSTHQDAYNLGKGVIIYDLQYMNQVKTISGKTSGYDVAVSPEKIYFAPPVDYSWAKQFAANTNFGALGLLDNNIYVKKFYPEPGTFAASYKEEYFVIDADFTDYLDNATVSNSTFWLTEKSGTSVPGHTVAASKIAIFSPDAQLKADTEYVAHLSKSIKSKSGKALYADVSWNFTTKNGTGTGSVLSNSTLNFTGINKLSVGSALQVVIVNETDSKNSSKIIPGRYWNWTAPLNNKSEPLPQSQPDPGQQTQEQQGSQNGNQGTQNGGGQVQQSGQQGGSQTPSPELNPQPEPPIGSGKASPELNPQPEPPAPRGQQGSPQGQTPSPNLNPQPEPPAPSFLDGIVNFFKSLFGMK